MVDERFVREALEAIVDEARATKPSGMTLDQGVEELIVDRLERGIFTEAEAALARELRKPAAPAEESDRTDQEGRPAMAAQTQVSIQGMKTTLVFGARYRLRFGADDRVLHDAELLERKANGDLLFAESEGAGFRNVRVRPSTIDAIFGSGTHVEPAPTIEGVTPPDVVENYRRAARATDDPELARVLTDEADLRSEAEALGFDESDGSADRSILERELADQAETDRLVEAFVAEGDTDPDSVAEKVHAAKTDSVVRRLPGESASAMLARLERPIPVGLGASYLRWIETGYGQEILEEAGRELRGKPVPVIDDLEAILDRIPETTSELDRKRSKKKATRPNALVGEPVVVDGRKWKIVELLDAGAIRVRGKAGKETTEAIVVGFDSIAGLFRGVAPTKARLDGTPTPTYGEPKLTRQGREALVAAAADPEAVAGATRAEDVPGVVVSSSPLGVRKIRDGDGWREVVDTHNHIWRCGECKRRLRAATCDGPADGSAPHAPVAAPPGARVEDRLGR